MEILYSHTQRPIDFGKAEQHAIGGETYAVREVGKHKIAWCNAVYLDRPKAVGDRAYLSQWLDEPENYIAQWRLVADTNCFALWKISAQLEAWKINQAIRKHIGLPELGAAELHRISRLFTGRNSFGVGGDTLTLAECEALAIDWSKRRT